MSAVNITLQPRPELDASVDHAIQAIVAGTSAAETCNTDLASGPWDFDIRPGYSPGSSMGDVIPTGSPRQGELPREYREAGEDELADRIRAAKATLGDRVVVLGHFYQREEVVLHADYVGDSFQLANAALEHPDAAHRRTDRCGSTLADVLEPAEDVVPRLRVITREIPPMDDVLAYTTPYDPLFWSRRGESLAAFGDLLTLRYVGAQPGDATISERWRAIAA